MQRSQLERRQLVPLDIETTFAFFADASNLQRLTPPWLHFEIVSPTGLTVSRGTLIDYKLRLHGIPIRWRSEITRWDPPRAFRDEQRRGPYQVWEHTHTFEAVEGGTVVTDRVVYAVPGGALIDRLFVRPDLKRIFDYRALAMRSWAAEQTSAAKPRT